VGVSVGFGGRRFASKAQPIIKEPAMKRSIPRRIALLAAVGAAAIGGSTAAWLGTASGTQSAGASLTFAIPSLAARCLEDAGPISAQFFVALPNGTIDKESPITQTCPPNPNDDDINVFWNDTLALSVDSPPTGTYQIGVELTSSTGILGENYGFFFTATNGSVSFAGSQAPAAMGSAADNLNDAQLVAPFVYSPKLFKLGQ
jgi:hypothetical protein